MIAMKNTGRKIISRAKTAALEVLHNNFPPSGQGLPSTAAWGYPEPYTRDLMLSIPGILATEDEKLIKSIRFVLKTLAENQTPHGLIPGLVDDPDDLEASDTTPLFLLGLKLYRRFTGDGEFLEKAARKACTWLNYQSPLDDVIIGQLPTSDWRDEQWVFGYGLYVNSIVFLVSRLRRKQEKVTRLKEQMTNRLSIEGKPYFAIDAFKEVYKNERFDLLGNSLAIIAGILEKKRSQRVVEWIEKECCQFRRSGQLSTPLPPVLLPYIEPGETLWRTRYADFNRPGDYHNGGIWPFAVGFYVVSLIKLGLLNKARQQILELARLVKKSRNPRLEYGFNEWYKAQTSEPSGQDWQTWSAATFLYAAECMENGRVLFLDP